MNALEEKRYCDDHFISSEVVSSATDLDPTHHEENQHDPNAMSFGDQTFLSKARLRVTSLVERMNDGFEQETAFLPRVDITRLRLPGTDSYWEDDELSLDFYDKHRKDDDDEDSTGTADTDEDYHESSDLSNCLRSESSQSGYDPEDDQDDVGWSDLRKARFRSRFEPFLPSGTNLDIGVSPRQTKSMWRIRALQQDEQVRFELQEDGQENAVMVLYDQEVFHAIEGIIDSTFACEQVEFELLVGTGEESQRLSSDNVLPKLKELVHEKLSNGTRGSLRDQLFGAINFLTLSV